MLWAFIAASSCFTTLASGEGDEKLLLKTFDPVFVGTNLHCFCCHQSGGLPRDRLQPGVCILRHCLLNSFFLLSKKETRKPVDGSPFYLTHKRALSFTVIQGYATVTSDSAPPDATAQLNTCFGFCSPPRRFAVCAQPEVSHKS